MIDGAAQRVDVIEAIPFFADAGGLAEALSRLAADRALPSHLRVEALAKLAAPPPKVRKSILKALQKLVSDPDAAVAKAAATALAAMDGEVR